MMLLLVDDEASLLQLLGQSLVRQGHTVEQASNVATAQALSANRFDAAIVDWMLPDGSGLDLGVSLLRRDLGIKVIFTSGYPMDLDVIPADFHPRVHLLQKPFLPRALAETLKNL